MNPILSQCLRPKFDFIIDRCAERKSSPQPRHKGHSDMMGIKWSIHTTYVYLASHRKGSKKEGCDAATDPFC